MTNEPKEPGKKAYSPDRLSRRQRLGILWMAASFALGFLPGAFDGPVDRGSYALTAGFLCLFTLVVTWEGFHHRNRADNWTKRALDACDRTVAAHKDTSKAYELAAANERNAALLAYALALVANGRASVAPESPEIMLDTARARLRDAGLSEADAMAAIRAPALMREVVNLGAVVRARA